MPLTVDEVGTAPGLARPLLVSSRRHSASGSTACGWKTRVLPWRPNLEAGGGGGRYSPFPLITRRGKVAWGWGGRVKVGSSGTSGIRLLGTTMRHREPLRPLPPIKQMH